LIRSSSPELFRSDSEEDNDLDHAGGVNDSGMKETMACLNEMKTLLLDLTMKVEKNSQCLQELEHSNER